MSSTTLKIAIVWDWGLAEWANPLVWDGLKAAMKKIGETHQVDWYLGGKYPPDNYYDWILPWGVGSIPFNYKIQEYHSRKALLCAGHPQDTANFDKFEAIFVESPAVQEQIRAKGFRSVLAFGTDVSYFQPEKLPKIIDCFYPATFSAWKRQDLFSVVGDRGLACGTVQPDGLHLLNICRSRGVYVIDGLVPTALVSRMYNMSRCVVITSWHGSERTLLEAMSCNIPVVITKDNILTCSLANEEVTQVEPTKAAIMQGVRMVLEKEVNTRLFIVQNYSHHIYADQIMEVLNEQR